MNSEGIVIRKGEGTNLILFSAGQLVSLFGSSIYVFAISLYVLKMTGSGLSFAITLIQGVLPTLLIGPFAGVLSDRFSKRLLIISMDVANGVLFTLLCLLCNYYSLTLPIIYITTFLANSLSVIFGTAIEAVKPDLVSEDNLIRMNQVSQIINSLASILGPVIGGMVFAFMDVKYFMLINAVSFFCSAISKMFIDYDLNRLAEAVDNKAAGGFTMRGVLLDIKDGFLYLYKQKELMDIIVIFIVLNVSIGLSIMVPLPYAVNNVLKLGPAAYGVMEGFLPVGMIVGAIAVEKVYRKVHINRIINLSMLAMSVSILAMGIPLLSMLGFARAFYLALYCFIMAAVGSIISFIDVPALQLLQTAAEEEYRGRVISTSVSICKIALPLALILAGIIIELVPVIWIFFGVGGLSLVYTALLLYKDKP